MDINALAPRHKAFKLANAEMQGKWLKSTRAWLNVQQLLKRSGRTCVPTLWPEKGEALLFFADGVAPNDIFYFEDVAHLCRLYMGAEKIRKQVDTRMMQCFHLGLWPYNLILVPRHIQQIIIHYQGSERDKKQEKSDSVVKQNQQTKLSLYQTLLRACGNDKVLLNTKLGLIDFDLAYGTGKSSSNQIARNVQGQLPQVFQLLIMECSRLGLNKESATLRWLGQVMVEDSTLLNNLSTILFFELLFPYLNEPFSFFSFFRRPVQELTFKHGEDKEYWRKKIQVRIEYIGEIYPFLLKTNKKNRR